MDINCKEALNKINEVVGLVTAINSISRDIPYTADYYVCYMSINTDDLEVSVWSHSERDVVRSGKVDFGNSDEKIQYDWAELCLKLNDTLEDQRKIAEEYKK